MTQKSGEAAAQRYRVGRVRGWLGPDYQRRHAALHEAGEAWRIQQCRALQQYVRKQLTHSWAKSGRCDVVACQNVTECFLPYRNGSDHDSEGYHSDSYGAQKSDLGEICSVPLKADQFAPRTIVVCSPQCYDRAKTLKHSAPTLFGLFGPILRGTACQRTFPLHHECLAR